MPYGALAFRGNNQPSWRRRRSGLNVGRRRGQPERTHRWIKRQPSYAAILGGATNRSIEDRSSWTSDTSHNNFLERLRYAIEYNSPQWKERITLVDCQHRGHEHHYVIGIERHSSSDSQQAPVDGRSG